MKKAKEFLAFLLKQYHDLQDQGLKECIRKCKIFFNITVSIPIILFLKIMKPWFHIQFGRIFNSRLGHFAIEQELYLCNKELNSKSTTIDLFFLPDKSSNSQLEKMWRDKINISPYLGKIYNIIKHSLVEPSEFLIKLNSIDSENLLERTGPHLKFSEDEEFLGKKILRKMGINEDVPFICFHARDSSYLRDSHAYNLGLDPITGRVMTLNHDYRDSNIENYLPAAEFFTKKGYYLIRMGSIVKDPLGIENSNIIDYATKNRSDFLDIYLCSKCYFFIGSGTGITSVAQIFRKPIVWVNFIALGYAPTYCSNYLIIPKKYWSRKDTRYLTISEIFSSGAAWYYSSEQFESAGIDVVENTPAEILDVSREMEERLKGTWITTNEDEILQEKFWNLFTPKDSWDLFYPIGFKKRKYHGKILARIGTDFLRQNRELLK